jgi:hypothetical protein
LLQHRNVVKNQEAAMEREKQFNMGCNYIIFLIAGGLLGFAAYNEVVRNAQKYKDILPLE